MISKICQICGYSRPVIVDYYDITNEETWGCHYKGFRSIEEAVLWCDFHGYTILDRTSFDVSLGLRYSLKEWKQYCQTIGEKLIRERNRLLYALRVL